MTENRKRYITACEHCGVEFVSHNIAKKFCSKDCVSLSARLSPLEKIARANQRWLKGKPKRKAPSFSFASPMHTSVKKNDETWYAQ